MAPTLGKQQDTLKDLAQELRQRRLVAFVGAGVSMAAGYPSWSQLMEKFHRKLRELPAPEGPKYLHQLGRMPDDLWRAEEYRRLLGPAGFEALIWDTFKPVAAGPGGALKALTRLPFRHFLTTNYDDLLETAVKGSRKAVQITDWQDNDALSKFLSCLSRPKTPTHVVYLHGRYSEPARIVLSESDYVKRYVLNDDAARKLFALFLTQPVLFVGFSLSDPELTYIMRNVNARLGGGAQHFAILPSPGVDEEDALSRYYEKKFGVHSVFYPPGNDHAGLDVVLNDLAVRCNIQIPSEERPRTRGRTRASSARARTIEAEALVRTHDPDDPNKGQFGGKARVNGWTLDAQVEEAEDSDWFHVELIVKAPPQKARVARKVRFHLHPTFSERVIEETTRNGRATTSLISYGAFTVGVEVVKESIRLELDLAQLRGAPATFKNR